MNNYLKEAERLLDELRTCTLAEATHYASPDFKRAKASEEAANRARAALLAHIQRGAVLEGWKEATIAWEVCASIHREYAKKKDPFFTTRQADFVKHTEAARSALLAANPAPDHFRDAAEMVAESSDGRIASAIHYPECWDTAAYPTVESALSEVFAHYRCTEHDAPAEVPMPKPVTHYYDDDEQRDVWCHSADQMRTYGAACRAAGEAAGYARGLKEADKLLQALRDIADPIAAYERDLPPGYKLDGAACVRMADNPETYRRMAREAIADLRGEVK